MNAEHIDRTAGPLGPAQLDFYEREGYVVLGPTLGADECAELLEVERRIRPDGYGSSTGLAVMDQVEHVSAVVRRVCCDGPHLDAVEQLIGPAVALTHNQFVTKLPGHGTHQSEIPLHQDDGYGTLDPPDDVTVWIALTATTGENGCLVVAPASHRRGLVAHQVAESNRAFREATADRVVEVELAAGEAIAFSGLLLHGSGDNRSAAERVALFARYCRPEVAMVTEGGRPVLEDGHSWMVRGDAPLSTWRSANAKFDQGG